MSKKQKAAGREKENIVQTVTVSFSANRRHDAFFSERAWSSKRSGYCGRQSQPITAQHH